MSDEFIRSLQGDWQSQDHGADSVLRRLRRNRWTPHILLGAELAVFVLALAVGVWFAWQALRDSPQQLLFALSAGMILLTAPTLCVAGLRARRASLAWAAETPESLLKVGMRRAESSLRAIRVGRWHVAITGVFLAILWVCEALGVLHAMDFLVFYTVICVLVSAVAWLWMNRADRRARSERAACARLLEALQASLGSDAGVS
jgi:uncharacterized membrane protein YedE/YeeE